MKTHGHTVGYRQTPEFKAWDHMLQRCRNPRHPRYKDWGGRGITVCKRWEKFENFLADMGMRPSAQHSLDRRNNDRGYDKRNCRWATPAEQRANRRPPSNRIVYKGKTFREWGEALGIAPSAVYGRYRRGTL